MDHITLVAIVEALEQDKRKRTYWVHPLYSKRLNIGQFHTLYEELSANPDKFLEYYRLSIKSFDEILNLIITHITKKYTNYRIAISPTMSTVRCNKCIVELPMFRRTETSSFFVVRSVLSAVLIFIFIYKVKFDKAK